MNREQNKNIFEEKEIEKKKKRVNRKYKKKASCEMGKISSEYLNRFNSKNLSRSNEKDNLFIIILYKYIFIL